MWVTGCQYPYCDTISIGVVSRPSATRRTATMNNALIVDKEYALLLNDLKQENKNRTIESTSCREYRAHTLVLVYSARNW